MSGILGCYVSVGVNANMDKNLQTLSFEKGRLFRSYIWGENGITKTLNNIASKSYGHDVEIILFEFFINPLPPHIKYIEKGINYKKKDKSVGIPISATDENFFCKNEEERSDFFKNIFYEELGKLKLFATKKKIDIQIDAIIEELKKVL